MERCRYIMEILNYDAEILKRKEDMAKYNEGNDT